MMRRGVLDIGTNSVKALVCDVCDSAATPVYETGEQTRLGEGLYSNGALGGTAIQKTLEVIDRYRRKLIELETDTVRVIGTSAMREASNPEALAIGVRERFGLRIEVIDGETEARLAYLGAVGANLKSATNVVMDVGGGSVEFIVGVGADIAESVSLPLGVVRLLNALRPEDPPSISDRNAARERVLVALERDLPERLLARVREARATSLICVGGSSAILACVHNEWSAFPRDAIDQTRLNRRMVRELVNRFWEVPEDVRKKIVGLPENRADVILMAISLYEATMEFFGFEEMATSTRGLRFGAILEEAGDWQPLGG